MIRAGRIGSLLLLAALAARPGFAQTDVVGDWGNRFHEDLWERRSGLQVGDFTGFAFTDAGRLMAEAWPPAWFSLRENLELRPGPHHLDGWPCPSARVRAAYVGGVLDRRLGGQHAGRDHHARQGGARPVVRGQQPT